MSTHLSRRQLLQISATAYLGTKLAPVTHALNMISPLDPTLRCINIVNFIREVDPREAFDMLLPVQKQMELIKQHELPATWLLQFDALVSGPYVPFLKEQMPANHEVGFWFEMNEKHCNAAGVEWRGRPGYEWDHIPHVAFTIGYTKDERRKLADTAMKEFKRIWGRYPKSVASWNLDSFTIAHLVERYGVKAFAVCRDQIATDGFTIWGGPIAGYYPSKNNCWCAAADPKHQISAPVFRMLGQDPVYYYDRSFTMADGQTHWEPDTMEPAWPSGQNDRFISQFLEMIERTECGAFAYAQLGQENTFKWEQQAEGFAKQMVALQYVVSRKLVHVETMGESGERFKKAYRSTPAQAQIMLDDPFGNTEPACGSIWYQTRHYRANLHLRGNTPYLRDLVVYRDEQKQPFLDEPTRLTEVEQKAPFVVDGYHWGNRAGAYITVDGQRVELVAKPEIQQKKDQLDVQLLLEGGEAVQVSFGQREVVIRGPETRELAIELQCERSRVPLKAVGKHAIRYAVGGFEYEVKIANGSADESNGAWRIRADRGIIRLNLGQ